MNPRVDEVVEEIRRLFKERGDSEYGGESVTQLEHALQAATMAERDGGSPETISAALLHDVGHLLHDLPDDAPEDGIDDVHERLAHKWLCNFFGPEVTEPVRLHVAAKRYLCSVDPSYRNILSEPSLLSLELQGGLLGPEEQEEFENHQLFEEVILVRRYDDRAKDPTMKTPDLEHFLSYVEQCVSTNQTV